MLKKYWNSVSHFILVTLFAVLLLSISINSSQASMPFVTPIAFHGEYSQNGGEWRTLEDDWNLSALDGEYHRKTLGRLLHGHND